MAQDSRPWERVADADALPPGAHRCVRLASGRHVLVLRHGADLYAVDAACYHHGGPLAGAVADIEDIGGRAVIVCPWHKFRIALDNGEGLYQGVDMVRDPDTGQIRPSSPRMKSKGVRQRVHGVREAEGGIWVSSSSSEEELPSDQYAYEEMPAGAGAGAVHSSVG